MIFRAFNEVYFLGLLIRCIIVKRLSENRRAVDVLHVYIGIRDIEVYEHMSNM